MEEALSVKAPATRSRRRMSVEQLDENKSPAVNTPTKKRGGRRGIKPDLELIDENTPENATTRRTTKILPTKDIEESQEKAVTPSRRSTRIKSNTSIVSETAIAVDSPRSKRATRRASQAGSDGEAQVTPIRQTRRTRKNSTSSIDKVSEHQIPTKQAVQITEVIIEEPEMNIKNTQAQIEITIDENISPNNTRRSPRLLEKNKNTTPAKYALDDQEDLSKISESIASSEKKSDDISPSTIASKISESPISEIFTNTKLDESQISEKNRLSTSSANLIKELNSEKTKFTMSLNKSGSNAECKENKIKRHRTKSWSTISTLQNSQSSTDSESNKDKFKSQLKFSFRIDDKSRSGDESLKASVNLDKSYPNGNEKNSTNFIAENNSESLDKISNLENIANESENNIPSLHQKKVQEVNLLTSELLSKEPSGNIKTTIFIEDSDSNSEKVKIKSRHESEDQCVPVVDNPTVVIPRINFFPSILDKSDHNIINKSDLPKTIDSCEPMDVDETIPENTILSESQSKKLSISERKSSTCDFNETNLSSKQIANISEQKTSVQNIDKSGIETKSTLILSQLKDNSTADNNVSSTVTSQVTNKLLSKTVDDLNISHENDLKKNISLHCSTSTPLQDKNIQKFKGIQADFASNVNESKIRSTDSESKNAARHVFEENKTVNNSTKFKDSESSEDEANLINTFCKDRAQKISEQQVSIKFIDSHLKKVRKLDIVNDSSNKLSKNENHKEKVLFMKQQESNSSDEESNSNDEESNKLTKNEKNVSDMSSSEADEINSDYSQGKSNFVDREAADAGTDYESGDSQDESELQYQKENEIIEQGETLSTEEEFSEDSDYENDSFIVSSNEDEELLDGTDDDLSMSDNELKMNAKSKKKYNDRKMKEQKKASREMFESRHKLKSSNKNPFIEKSVNKKNKRRQVISSESEEDLVKPRKIDRRRLDSTKEATLIKDENEQKISMKNNAPLSDSVDGVHDADEIEMTVYTESVEESDPFSNTSKKEPKITQENINSMENIIEIDKNSFTEKTQIELSKSLEASITPDDDSLSSDNENIIQNYDSILKDLNKTKTDTTNIGNTSLNRVTKRGKKDKPCIFEDLNLTQVKSVKKNKIKHNEVTNNQQEILSKTDLNNESSSDSIDLHLLFSEESNNSDDVQSKKNANTNSDDFIPTTKTEDKTDLRKSKGKEKENDVNFFIDTVGSFRETETVLNKSQNISLMENEGATMEISDDTDSNKDLPQTVTSTTEKISLDQMENDLAETDSDDEAPLEISYQKKKEPKRKSKEQDTLNIPMVTTEGAVNKSPLKTPGSERKKKRSLDARHDEENDISNELTTNTSLLKTSAKKTSEKKKKRQSESHCDEQNELLVGDLGELFNISKATTPGSQKKKSLNKLLADDGVDGVDGVDRRAETANSDKKRKKSPSKLFALDEEKPIVPEESFDNCGTTSKKRKRKSSVDISKEEILSKDIDATENVNEPLVGSKKKKRKITTQDEIVLDVDAAEDVDEPPVGSKKKKRKVTTQDEIVPEIVRKEESRREHLQNNAPTIKFQQITFNNTTGTDESNKKRNKKRKEREDDGANPISKMRKEITFDKVPRLPSSLIMKLDKESQEEVTEKPEVVSTTQFLVQKMKKKKKSKPSKYLEDSVYINEDENEDGRRTNKKVIAKPKVLPFVPTASTSSSGYTTTFKVNVLPREIKFIAQTNTVSNFRENYLYSKKIKRFGTYEMYKRQRSAKMSKF